MSIALERIETNGFGRVIKCACDTSRFESTSAKERKESSAAAEEEEEDDWRRSSSSTTTSSSIGRNSDEDVSGRSSDVGECEENEVQSSYKGGLDMMDSLEQVLPMRRGISSFYNGKSKSFTSLVDASSNSIKDLSKPENAYTRRRRNLLAINHVWDRNRNKRPIRPISSSKSTLALAMAMSSSESISSTSDESCSTPSPRLLPPLHPQTKTYFTNTPSSPPPSAGRNISNWRSYSMADVREYTNAMGSANQHYPLIHDKSNS